MRRARLCVVVLWVAAAVAMAAVAVAADGDTCQAPREPRGKCVTPPTCTGQNDILLEGYSVYNVCPGCVQALNENESCEGKSNLCPFAFVCEKGKCVKGECRKEQDEEHATWTPTCARDGKFNPRQCKGSKGAGNCYCWSPKGQRLFGQAAWTDATERNMHCGCSLSAWRLAEEEGKGAHELPRCAPDGSFEALQCARGVCWCADSETGEPVRRVVPETAAHLLFCYRAEEVGASYRRRCDSQLEARARIQEVMQAHGTTPYGLPYVNCDLDGSFGAVQDGDKGARFCASKDKTRIGSYVDNGNTNMNCNCARDSEVPEFKKECIENGNYNPKQREGEDNYCVDEDGYFTKAPNPNGSCTS